MKKPKFIRLRFFIILLFLFPFVSIGQMSGIYTLGSSGNDSFFSFSHAVNNLKKGVSGPVTIYVSAGVYFDQVLIPAIPGTSDTNTVTFVSRDSNNSNVVLRYKSTLGNMNYTLQIAGASHIHFKHITFSSSGMIFNRVVFIDKYAVDISFRDCVFQNSMYNNDLIYVDNQSKIKDLQFDSCVFNYGEKALNFQYNNSNDSGLIIRKCKFNQQFQYGVVLRGQTNALIFGNSFKTNSQTYAFECIKMDNCKAGNKIISNNIIIKDVLAGSKAIAIYLSGDYYGKNLIANNMISLQSNETSIGIEVNESKNIDLFHNSIKMLGSNRTSASLNLIRTDSLRVKNNIATNISGGFVLSFTGNTNVEMDYNIYYTTATFFATMYLSNFSELSTWQSNTYFDLNSYILNPGFLSNINLHTFSVLVADKGTPLNEVTYDIDGQPRSSTAPDPGADEFNPLSQDLSIYKTLSPVANENCDLDTNENIVFQLINHGLNDVDSFDIYYSINGKNQIKETWHQKINSLDTVNLISKNLFNFRKTYLSNLEMVVKTDSDQYHYNDTIFQQVKNVKSITEFPFFEDFEKGFSEYFTVGSGSEAKASIDFRASYKSNYGMHFQGTGWQSTWVGGLSKTTPQQAWDSNTNSLGFARSCLIDASELENLRLQFKMRQTFSWGNKYSYFRVMVNDTIPVADQNGIVNFNPTSGVTSFELMVFDLDSFAGKKFKLSFEAANKHHDYFYNDGDNVFIDDIQLFETANKDIGILEIINPTLSYCSNDSDQLLVRLKNFGADTLFNHNVEVLIYTPIDTHLVKRSFVKTLAPNQCDTFFIGYVNTNHLGQYYFRANTILLNDTVYSNDTLINIIEFYNVVPLPHLMHFDSSDALESWYGKNFWNSYKGHHKIPSAGLSNNIWSEDSVMTAVYRKRIGPVTPYSHILFDYRIVDFYPPFQQVNITDNTKLHLLISTDCARTFDTVFTIDSAFHVPTTAMRNVQVKLDKYINQDIVLGFIFESDSFNFNYVDIDNILIADLPVVDLTSDTAACKNDSLFISVPYNNDFTFNWYNIKKKDTIPDSNIFYPDSSGKYILKVTNSHGFSNSDTIEITIYPNPDIELFYVPNICVNDEIKLVATGGVRYKWNFGDTNNMTSYKVADTTDFSVEVWNQFNCYAKDSFTIEPYPLPVKEIYDTSICKYDSAVYQLGLNDHYYWSNADTSRQVVLKPLQTKQYWVRSRNMHGCDRTDTFTVFVKDLPQINLGKDTIGYADIPIRIDIPNPGVYDSFYWMDNSTASYKIFDTTGFGINNIQTAFVTVYKDLCKNSDTILVDFEISPGIESEEFTIAVYPNPVSDNIYLEFPENANAVCQLLDLNGKVVMEKRFIRPEATINRLNLSELKDGVYILRLTISHQVFTTKIIKQ
jgi:hypothetical protein